MPNSPPGTLSERLLTVGGQPAVRWEVADPPEPDAAPVTRLLYVVDIPGAGSANDWLVASTTTDQIGVYETNVMVLDWMMEHFEFLTDAN